MKTIIAAKLREDTDVKSFFIVDKRALSLPPLNILPLQKKKKKKEFTGYLKFFLLENCY